MVSAFMTFSLLYVEKYVILYIYALAIHPSFHSVSEIRMYSTSPTHGIRQVSAGKGISFQMPCAGFIARFVPKIRHRSTSRFGATKHVTNRCLLVPSVNDLIVLVTAMSLSVAGGRSRSVSACPEEYGKSWLFFFISFLMLRWLFELNV